MGRFEGEDYGIYLADRVADKDSLTPTGDSRKVLSTLVVDGDDISIDQLSINRFTIRHIATPARPLLQRIDSTLTVPMLACSTSPSEASGANQNRRSGARYPSGQLRCTALAAACPCSLVRHVSAYICLWDICMHGRNLARNPLFNDDTSCPLCGGADSQYHIIRECRHKSMRDCRQKHIALLEYVICNPKTRLIQGSIPPYERESRGESCTALHLRTPHAKHSERSRAMPLLTTAAAHMDILRSTPLYGESVLARTNYTLH